jgi:hypothetical protein
MRRDLLTYMQECQETLDEFQAMIDEGPLPATTAATAAHASSTAEPAVAKAGKDPADGDGAGGQADGGGGREGRADQEEDEEEWEAFLDGRLDRYGPSEVAVAEACVALVKCSRGTLNLVLQAEDAWGGDGSRVREREGGGGGGGGGDANAASTLSEDSAAWMERMGQVHELARSVGAGATDLGAALYPPLALDAVGVQVLRQSGAIQDVLRSIARSSSSSSGAGDDEEDDDGSSARDLAGDLPPPVLELHRKLEAAVRRRRAEALEAIAEAQLEGGGAGGQE